MKKILSLTFALLISLLCIIPAYASGGDILSFARINARMPQISVELDGEGYDINSISATLDGESLSVSDVHKYDKNTDTTCAYILVDLSTSMWYSIELVKRSIVSYIESMGPNDKLILMTFGETEVKTLLNGDEERSVAIDTVNQLVCNEQGTVFYEALSRAYQMSSSSAGDFDREYVIAFSDGIDYQMGKTTFDEVVEMYDSHALPLYAACSSNATQESSDRFGELARTSGGEISIIYSDDVFTQFMDEINDVSLISLNASNNRADGSEKPLVLKIGESQITCNVPIVHSQADTTPPEISEIAYDSVNGSVIIAYSEKVVGAASSDAYKITDGDGNLVDVSKVYYTENSGKYELVLTNKLYNGDYSVEFFGITDDSAEANPLTGKLSFSVTDSAAPVETESETVAAPEPDVPPAEIPQDKPDMSMWIVAVAVGAVILIAAAIVIVVVMTSKKRSDDEPSELTVPVRDASLDVEEHIALGTPEVKHHIRAVETARIGMRIRTGKTSEQQIETNIVSSLIVGRSDTSDIYIDDTKLSRQHFVIEYESGRFYITDLQSRNGTMLNGIRMNTRHPLSVGDRITAGLSEITVTVLNGNM